MNIIGAETFESNMGVGQGASTSCSLYTFYLNCTVENIKSYGHDGFLCGLHSLLEIDDTVMLATGRQPMCDKIDLLWQSTKPINMGLHPIKSLYTTVNVTDQEPFTRWR